MSERVIRYLIFMVLLAFAVATGMLIWQVSLLKRLGRLEERVSERVGRIYSLADREEEYRALRTVRPEYRETLYPAVSTYRPGLDTLVSFQNRLRADLKEWIGLDESLLKSRVELRSVGQETLDSLGVVREEVEFYFAGNENHWLLHGYLLYPVDSQGPLPGIFCLNGHSGKARAVAGLEEDYTHGYGLALARTGCRVLTFDWCFEGQSRLTGGEGREYKGHDSIYEYMAETGHTGLALYMENAYCALAALRRDPGVDPSRIAVTGISRGGELTTYFAALFAPELTAYYASGAGFPFSYRRFGGGCRCTYIERIFDNYEFSDLMTAAAPLPAGLQLGVKDDIWGYWDNSLLLVKSIRSLYESLGAPQNFVLDIHEGRHEYDLEQGCAFFKKYLLAP
ncbi:MAG TPA: acetylxylan esterase [archaeon]|nr:acetylxylan esterase [archaeon]